MNLPVVARGALLLAAVALASAALGLALGEENPHPGVIAAVVACLALVGMALGLLAFRHTGQTIAAVSAAAGGIAEGHLGERVAQTTGLTGDLTQNFNTMAQRVQELFKETADERARLEAAFEASADGMIALSADTTVRLVNGAAARMFMEDRGTMLGRPLIESTRDYELDALVRQVTSGGPAETRIIAFSPGRTAVRASAVPIRGAGNWAVLLVLSDLTEVHRFDQARRDFVSNVSHELRTPLASIKALAETLDGEVDPSEISAFVKRINAQVDRLAALVTELLDLSRIESGALVLTPEQMDLAAVVAEAAAVVRPRADARGVAIALPSSGPTVEADRSAVIRIVTNLLDNAVKFSPSGTQVTVGAQEQNSDTVEIVVRDEGPGIAAADLPRLFERFYKAEHSRSDPGTGLGLAIVKHLVRTHGGTVSAESEPGRGATFRVRLPRAFAGAQGR